MKKNSVVHFEIYAADSDKLGEFYKSLFDWSIEKMPDMDYGWIKTVETDAKGVPTQPGGSRWRHPRTAGGVQRARVGELRKCRVARSVHRSREATWRNSDERKNGRAGHGLVRIPE